jgi:hypothetical protein
MILRFSRSNRKAYNLVVCFWIFSGALILFLTYTIIPDETRVQEDIKETLNRRKLEDSGVTGGDAESRSDSGRDVFNPIRAQTKSQMKNQDAEGMC